MDRFAGGQDRAGRTARVRPGDKRRLSALSGDVQRELRQTANHGRGDEAVDLIEAAAQALEDEDFEFARAAAGKAKEIAPRSGTVRSVLGDALYRLGAWREAQRELAAYKRLSERRDRDHVIADCERALGRPEKALAALRGIKASQVGEELAVEALLVASGALFDLGRDDDAVHILQEGPVHPRQAYDYHLRLWYALADALERTGHRAQARRWWDLVYAEDPEFFDVAQRRLT